jgi:hypothetical protein
MQNARSKTVACGRIEGVLDGCFEDFPGPEPNGEITAIAFPEPGERRARKVVMRSRARATGRYPSLKMGRMLEWESIHERNAFILLDADPTVTLLSEQPCMIHYVIDGTCRNYYPDVYVKLKNGLQELREIQTERDALQAEVAQRTSLLKSILPTWGYSYKLVIAEELSLGPRLNNSKELLRFGRHHISDIEREAFRRIFKESPSVLLSDACAHLYGRNARRILCHLALEGKLFIDMNLGLTAETRFFVGEEGL